MNAPDVEEFEQVYRAGALRGTVTVAYRPAEADFIARCRACRPGRKKDHYLAETDATRAGALKSLASVVREFYCPRRQLPEGAMSSLDIAVLNVLIRAKGWVPSREIARLVWPDSKADHRQVCYQVYRLRRQGIAIESVHYAGYRYGGRN